MKKLIIIILALSFFSCSKRIRVINNDIPPGWYQVEGGWYGGNDTATLNSIKNTIMTHH